ncbi:MAG: hypothetical protein ACLFOY_10620 [Desulfatibacillaceae bacterium]
MWDKTIHWNTDPALLGEQEFKLRLRAMVASPMEIALTWNRSSVVSVKRKRDGIRVLRVQHAFRGADQRTMEALARFAFTPDDWCREQIDRYVENNQHLFRLFARPERATKPCVTRGWHRDLSVILLGVMRMHGIEADPPNITWSRGRPLSKGRSSIRFGSYSHKTGTISIHPVLDKPAVPEFFVEYIIYHELLHALYPPVRKGRGRRDVHNHEFNQQERLFYRYGDAKAYEARFVREHLG